MTREEAINNPGGIVHSKDVWEGMASDQPDAKFVKFKNAIFGLRALAKNFRSYQREGINTLTAAAAKWAPRKDGNDPVAYAAFLADACQWHPDTPVVFDSIMYPLVKGVVTRENGRCIYPDTWINTAIAMAQGKTVSTPDPVVKPAPVTAVVVPAPAIHPSIIKGAGAAVGAYVSTLVIGAITDFLPQVHLTADKTAAITGLFIFVALHIIKDPSQ